MVPLNRSAQLLSGVATAALLACSPAVAQSWVAKNPSYKTTPYVAGDMHNHNVCIDGSVSAPFTVDKAFGKFKLDWFTLGNHGGSGNRDCRLASDPSDPINGVAGSSTDPHVNDTWSQTLGTTVSGITINALKGDANAAANGIMYRWQNIEEVEYPILMQRSQLYRKLAIEGIESVAPSHEHVDVSVLNGQFPATGTGNADRLAEFEFRWDRADADTVGPVDASSNPIWTGKSFNNSGTAGHQKAVQSVTWLQANAPVTSYYVPTHSERAGVFSPTGSAGWNIEQFRDFNNVGPTVAFGIESPGHAADPSHSYSANAVGRGTYGGDGIYTAKIGGLWDGMLGEGRNTFNFLSSDWHSRGIFGSNDPRSTADFFPGEYSRLYVPNTTQLSAQNVVDEMRSGNTYAVAGDLIGNDFLFRACSNNGCAGMGQTLVVNPGDQITFEMRMTVPAKNNSPYSFNNPLLTQVGISQPLGAPVLDHVDLISGEVTGPISPSSPLYAAAGYTGGMPVTVDTVAASVYNPSAAIAATFGTANWVSTPAPNGATRKSFTWTIAAPFTPFYVRARGTNMPVSVPYVTDASGNPLPDTGIVNVPCADLACPSHLPTVDGTLRVKEDVEAWSNLWFRSNPIFFRPASNPPLLVEKNALLAQSYKAAATGH